MATDLRQLSASLQNDADFRAWGSGLAAQFAAVGLVKTSDSGQINWSTVARPATGAFAGYEMWRFNDSLQASKPVFLKVEYGTSGTSVTIPSLRLTVGTSTDGAGTLLSQVTATRSLPPAGTKSAGITLPSYVSGSSSRLNFCTNLDSSSPQYFMFTGLERTKLADGTDTGDGIIFYSSSNNGGFFQVIPFVGTLPTSPGANVSISPASAACGGFSTVGTDVALGPTLAIMGKTYFASWCTYAFADIGELVPFTVVHLGATRTYMPLGDGISYQYSNIAAATGTSIAMLWE